MDLQSAIFVFPDIITAFLELRVVTRVYVCRHISHVLYLFTERRNNGGVLHSAVEFGVTAGVAAHVSLWGLSLDVRLHTMYTVRQYAMRYTYESKGLINVALKTYRRVEV
jgi:hypothetical protein